MGICGSSSTTSDVRELGTSIASDYRFVLLGLPFSGKTTLFKQVKVTDTVELQDKELKYFSKDLSLEMENNVHHVFTILGFQQCEQVWGKLSIYPVATRVWNRELIGKVGMGQLLIDNQQAIEESSDQRANGGETYLLRHWEKICHPSYLPLIEDYLQYHSYGAENEKTTQRYRDLVPYTLFDLGKEKAERNQYITKIQPITSIVFYVLGLSQYDFMVEETKKNCFHAALEEFEDICNSIKLQAATIILVLNQIDLFKQKLMLNQNLDLISPSLKLLSHGPMQTFISKGIHLISEKFYQRFIKHRKGDLSVVITNAIDASGFSALHMIDIGIQQYEKNNNSTRSQQSDTVPSDSEIRSQFIIATPLQPWSQTLHREFPYQFQRVVKTLLLIRGVKKNKIEVGSKDSAPSSASRAGEPYHPHSQFWQVSDDAFYRIIAFLAPRII